MCEREAESFGDFIGHADEHGCLGRVKLTDIHENSQVNENEINRFDWALVTRSEYKTPVLLVSDRQPE